jgi:hypothetical protein
MLIAEDLPEPEIPGDLLCFNVVCVSVGNYSASAVAIIVLI